MERDGASRLSLDRERELVERARIDGAAYGELYDSYLPRIHAFIYRRVRDRSVAEDLTSMTFQSAFENERHPDFPNETFGGRLYRIASTAVTDRTRGGQRFASLDLSGEDASDDLALDSFALAFDREQLRRAMLNLPGQHRDLLVLSYYDDLDTDELCAVVSCSKEVLSARLHRALRALRMAIASESSDVS